jgi:hypothetical protein
MISNGRGIAGFRMIVVLELPLGWRSTSPKKGKGSRTGVGLVVVKMNI